MILLCNLNRFFREVQTGWKTEKYTSSLQSSVWLGSLNDQPSGSFSRHGGVLVRKHVENT